ncbi:hypothetical protein Glove_9g249 [Diversispora epigaea]|uniref:HMG box domain-containing protein n=1 Tax=Diversispora epigaea TaxID=1348612 RepID=A0A397JWZ5_9GLOM|nr:hypothetical protein Glove_9g249 [Diversispora epigaea]
MQVYSKENSIKNNESSMASCDQETFIPQLPQPPQFRTSKGGPPVPNFEYVSYDKVQDLYDQNKGTLYFIPEGFEPVLVPNDAKATSVTNLLENAKPVSNAPNVPRMLPDTDVRLPSFALPCGVAGPTPKASNTNSKVKVKKPPRPPNAFILYRRAKQPGIVAKNQGITNNEVSKEIGRMWHEEPPEVRSKFQKMADAAKQEHMKKYPEYRYRPRRPQERKRRIQPREDLSPTSGNTPTLPSQNFDASAFFARRISTISTDGENSDIYSPTTTTPTNSTNQPSTANTNAAMMNHHHHHHHHLIPQNSQNQHLLYADNSQSTANTTGGGSQSPPTQQQDLVHHQQQQHQMYLDATTMAKFEFEPYLEDTNSYDGNSSNNNNTNTFSPVTTSNGMIDFSVFDTTNSNASGEVVGYLGLGDYVNHVNPYDYHNMNNMTSLSFISTADEQYLRNPQYVKLDY